MFSTPILFLIFNRPDTAQVVFNRIREIQPEKLYVAADAPRKDRPGEIEKCMLTRSIIDQVDWPCEVKTLFRTDNLGCKLSVSDAITWFFKEEEYGIILEDDCLPHFSFFQFCQELLIKYKDDDRIGHIGGNCFVPHIMPTELSYDFCSVTHIWGWATWRRVWKNMDINFSFWDKYENRRSSLFCNKWEEIYFSSFVSDALKGRNGMSSWAIPYYMMLRVQNQLSVYPAVNLVTNIGLGDPNATHTMKGNNKMYVESQGIAFPLQHPQYKLNNRILNKAAIQFNFFSYKRLFRYLVKDF